MRPVNQPAEPTTTAVDRDDSFPRDEFGILVRHLPAYGRLAWSLARDPRLSRLRRLALAAAAGYVLSPIDLVPGIIPVAGQLDDLLVALGAIRVALDGLKPEVRAEKLASVGLTQADLDADLRATKEALIWLGRSGVRLARRTGARVRAGAGRVVTGIRRTVVDR
jgi:uncharacterized membrane protein YkvA (DUF1232 family)